MSHVTAAIPNQNTSEDASDWEALVPAHKATASLLIAVTLALYASQLLPRYDGVIFFSGVLTAITIALMPVEKKTPRLFEFLAGRPGAFNKFRRFVLLCGVLSATASSLTTAMWKYDYLYWRFKSLGFVIPEERDWRIPMSVGEPTLHLAAAAIGLYILSAFLKLRNR